MGLSSGSLPVRSDRPGPRATGSRSNRGDRLFWRDRTSVTPYTGTLKDWPREIAALIRRRGVTDIVLYGDTRPVHADAIRAATLAGVTIHVFEEGYLRPWWITYERGGSNGHSPVMDIGLDAMAAFLERPAPDPVEAPGHWGALRRHMAYGALYHGAMLSGGPRLEPHRGIPVSREFALHLKRLLTLPTAALVRSVATTRLRRGTRPYHLVLLQLDHDASYRQHGMFRTTPDFLRHVVDAFAVGAPPHHDLVVKAHPLEDGRVPIWQVLRTEAMVRGIDARVRYVGGGKLAPLLERARSVVTVNSTAAQQALMRGLPVKAFGRAVYSKPEFVSRQPLEDFFSDPQGPDRKAYAVFRQFLLETSQIPGSYYAATGRRQALRLLPDMMLSTTDRYQRRSAKGRGGSATPSCRGALSPSFFGGSGETRALTFVTKPRHNTTRSRRPDSDNHAKARRAPRRGRPHIGDAGRLWPAPVGSHQERNLLRLRAA